MLPIYYLFMEREGWRQNIACLQEGGGGVKRTKIILHNIWKGPYFNDSFNILGLIVIFARSELTFHQGKGPGLSIFNQLLLYHIERKYRGEMVILYPTVSNSVLPEIIYKHRNITTKRRDKPNIMWHHHDLKSPAMGISSVALASKSIASDLWYCRIIELLSMPLILVVSYWLVFSIYVICLCRVETCTNLHG